MPIDGKLYPHFFRVPDLDSPDGQRITGVRIGRNLKNPDDFIVGMDFKANSGIDVDDALSIANGIIAMMNAKSDPKGLIVTATPEEVVDFAKKNVPVVSGNRAERRSRKR